MAQARNPCSRSWLWIPGSRFARPGMTKTRSKKSRRSAIMSDISAVKALVFDVFGTVVDWRSSLIADFTKWGATRGIKADWTALVDGWRAVYVASMDEVRKHPERGYVILDTLHRQSLEKLVAQLVDHRVERRRPASPHHGLASAACLAGQRRRPDAAEDKIHHQPALERQCRAVDQHGEIRRPAVGPGDVGGTVRALQARSRNLSRRRAPARACSRSR